MLVRAISSRTNTAVAGIQVTVLDGPRTGYAVSTQSDQAALQLPAGAVMLRVGAAGHQTVDYPLTVSGAVVIDVNVAPNPLFTLTGIVRDTASGSAVRGAEVESIQGVNLGRGTSTATDGTYRLDQLTGGSMQIRVTADGYISQTTSVVLAGNQELNIALAPNATFRFTGMVKNGLGTAVSGAEIVTAEQGTLRTDASGRFDVRSVHNSLWVKQLSAAGYEAIRFLPSGNPIYLLPGDNPLKLRRVISVVISDTLISLRVDGQRRSVRVRATFDTNEGKDLWSVDEVALASSNLKVVTAHGSYGNELSVEGVSAGTAAVTAWYAGVTSSPVPVEVR